MRGWMIAVLMLAYYGTQAQTKPKFYIRLVLNTSEGEIIPNLNILCDPPVQVTGKYLQDGVYEVEVNRRVGTFVNLRFEPGGYVVLNPPPKGIVITDAEESAQTYTVCRQKEYNTWLKIDIDKKIKNLVGTNKHVGGKANFMDAANSHTGVQALNVSDLVASSRVNALSGQSDQVLREANNSFIQGNFDGSTKKLLKNKPFQAYDLSHGQIEKLKSANEINRQKILLLGDNYLVLGKLDSSLLCYKYVIGKDQAEDLTTALKIMWVYELKGDLQQFYFWIDQASRTIPRNGDDSARILVLRLIKKARTKGVKIADLDFLADSLNSITISDPTFEIRLHIMLATVYSQFKAVDKMDKALQFVWDKGAAEDKLSGFALLKEEYTNNGDEEAADSINDICVARAKIALASHNTSINRLLLDKFLLDKAIYRSVNGLDEDMDDDDDDEVNTTAVDSSFNTLMGEFLRSPDWISEMVVITALTNYHQAILQHSDSSFVFYNNMLTDLRGIGRKYDASLLRSLAYAALVNYYNLEEKEGPCISNFINCIKSAVIKAKDNPMYQYYLSTILTETVINDDYLKNQDCQRGVRQALDYYWQYDDHRNFMSPVIVSSYILTFNIKDEISLLKVFNQFSENLPDRIEEEMYWESYIKFMDYAFAVLLRSGNKVLLNQILGDNLRLHATKLAKQLNTTYNKGNITNYLNKAVYLSIKLKLAGGKTRTANEFLMQTIDAAAERFRKDSSYKPVLKELFLNSIPHLMLAEWRADTTSYSLWKANITRYEQSYTDTIMRSCLHISAYRIRWINAVGTSDSLKGLAAGQKDLAIRTDLELSALHILLDSSLVFPKHYTGMNIDPAVYSVTDKITSSYSSIVQLFILRNNADKAIMYARSYIEKDSNNNIAQLSLAAAEMYGGDTTGATARFHKALASMNLLNSTKYLSDYLDPYVKAGIDKGQAMTLITQLKTMQDIEEARKKQAPQREQPKDDSIIHVGNLIIVKNPTNP